MNLVDKKNIDTIQVRRKIPPLIKGYLRLGSFVGDGAVLDNQFGTIDICIILKTDLVSRRYRAHYETGPI